ncbi:nucleotidyltransferase domain-containing protein [Haloechinothrix halophila]|uniref:nucleotidyltransferase domain-containing protein n=1 Tax=Haloechinothrix halophila TaxID=1069073 RepID=UPI0003F68A23|nr:nucleotidyltransferase domain-containing protein [Haloechinothrix halophila]
MKAIQRSAYRVASELRSAVIGESGYGLAYGSHPAGTATPRSDLDLVFVGPRSLAPEELKRLIEAVCELHRLHGFDLDTEVDYAVKIHATFADVDAAINLRCFDADRYGNITASAVVAEPWYLNSRIFARRLLLNALTSPHVFLGGPTAIYAAHRKRAEQSLVRLAMSLLSHPASFTIEDAAAAVLHGPGQATGQDFLGYTRDDHLYTTLRRGVAHLVQCALLQPLDHDRFAPDQGTCRAAITQRRAARGPDATAWDNAR